MPHAERFYRILRQVEADLPIAEFLDQNFADRQYEELRRSVTRTVEGYDAADPRRFSTLALREEWLARDDGEHGRLRQGYGALTDYLAAECRRHGAAIHLGAVVRRIEESGGHLAAICREGAVFAADAVVLAVPLTLLAEIELPTASRAQASAAADIGFGNVVKLLIRFTNRWWADLDGGKFADLSFVISNATVPTWWTQHPDPNPVLTGWYAGPKADGVAALAEADLIEMGLRSLAEIFEVPLDGLGRDVVASRAVNWGNDPFALGAYSYPTPRTRTAQAALSKPAGNGLFFSGEALYAGPDIGTVEAALANGRQTALAILGAAPA
jgi:monoamine oxidase